MEHTVSTWIIYYCLGFFFLRLVLLRVLRPTTIPLTRKWCPNPCHDLVMLDDTTWSKLIHIIQMCSIEKLIIILDQCRHVQWLNLELNNYNGQTDLTSTSLMTTIYTFPNLTVKLKHVDKYNSHLCILLLFLPHLQRYPLCLNQHLVWLIFSEIS